MKINKVILENIFAYKGEVKFDLSDKTNTNIILGSNGFGKTSFINSLKLALHGITKEQLLIGDTRLNKYEFVMGSSTKHYSGLVNRTSAQEGNKSCSVSITFSEKEKNYKLIRTYKITTAGFSETFEIFNLDDPSEAYKDDDAQDFINRIISPELAKFFFFDGEKVQDIANFSNDDFRKMLENVLELDIFDQIIEDYTRLKKNYVKDSLKDDELKTNYETASKRQDNEKSIINESQNSISINKESLRTLKKDRTVINNKIKKVNSQFKDVLKEQELNLAELKFEKEKKMIVFKKISMSCLPLLLNKELGLKTEFDILNNYYDSNYIPIEILKKKKKEFMELVNEKIRNGEEIESLFDSVFFSENKGVRVSFVDTSKAEFQYKSLNLNLIAFQALLDDFIELDESIERQIKLIENTKVNIKENEISLSVLLDDQEKLFKNIAKKENNIEDSILVIKNAKDEIELLEQELHNLSRKSHREDIQELSIETCEKVIEAAKKSKLVIRFEKRESLEKILNNKFKMLVKEGYDASYLKINESFSINVFDKNNQAMDILSSSSGQKQIIATSLIWAISEYIDSEMPMIVDTPLGRLDKKNQKLLLENFFPNASAQLIILPTPSEFEAEGFDAITKNAGVFELTSNGSIATVEELKIGA